MSRFGFPRDPKPCPGTWRPAHRRPSASSCPSQKVLLRKDARVFPAYLREIQAGAHTGQASTNRLGPSRPAHIAALPGSQPPRRSNRVWPVAIGGWWQLVGSRVIVTYVSGTDRSVLARPAGFEPATPSLEVLGCTLGTLVLWEHFSLNMLPRVALHFLRFPIS